MRSKDVMSGAITPDTVQYPLFSFNTIYDTDMGLINVIKKDYLDPTVFDESFFKQSDLKIIKELYHRRELNPLLLIAKDKSNKELLDQYYKEFTETKEAEIIELCVTTEILNLVKMFKETNEMVPTIFYYTEAQRKELQSNPQLVGIKIIHYNELTEKTLEKYSQIFVKNITELNGPLSNIHDSMTYYISTFRCNFDQDNELKKEDAFMNIVYRGNHCISIFDMYNEAILEEG